MNPLSPMLSLQKDVRTAWHAFHDRIEGLRPELYRHCRHLTRLRFWFWTDDVIAEVCRELQVPYRVNGYRYWGPTSPHPA